MHRLCYRCTATVQNETHAVLMVCRLCQKLTCYNKVTNTAQNSVTLSFDPSSELAGYKLFCHDIVLDEMSSNINLENFFITICVITDTQAQIVKTNINVPKHRVNYKE